MQLGPRGVGADGSVLLSVSIEAPSSFSLKEPLCECGESSAIARWLDEDEDAPVLEISGMT